MTKEVTSQGAPSSTDAPPLRGSSLRESIVVFSSHDPSWETFGRECFGQGVLAGAAFVACLAVAIALIAWGLWP